MEDGRILSNIHKYAVRIGIDDTKHSLIGTGVLYPAVYGAAVHVITAAHVATELKDKIKNGQKGQLTFLDDTGSVHNESLDDAEKISIHSQYKESVGETEGYFGDLAVIYMPWGKWADALEGYHITGILNNATKLYGYGFPQSMDGEKNKRMANLLSGKSSFEGKIEILDYGRIAVNYQLNVTGEVERDSVLRGFSGTGLFYIDDNHQLYLAGVISCRRGEEPSGGKLWATDIKLLEDLIKRDNIRMSCPQTFQRFGSEIEKEFDNFRRNSILQWKRAVNSILEDNSIIPEMFADYTESDLLCEGNRKLCPYFWKGKLKEIVVLIGTGAITKDKLVNPIINLPEPYSNEQVTLLYICTELDAAFILGEMIKNNQFTEEGRYDNNTILIINAKQGHNNCHIQFKRRDCRSILQNIAQGYEQKYVDVQEFCDKIGRLIEKDTGIEQYLDFDIVEGKLKKCNLAAFGVGELMNILNQESPQEMKTEMNRMLCDLWKEKN